MIDESKLQLSDGHLDYIFNKEYPIIEITDDINNIQEFIDKNMIDDPNFEKILDIAESTQNMPLLDNYTLWLWINSKEDSYKHFQEYYNLEISNYRKKLRKWWFEYRYNNIKSKDNEKTKI